MQRFELPAPAKLNRFLHITGRRQDGYHELQTIFQLVDIHDVLVFEPAEDIDVQMDGVSIPVADNLVYRAAMLLSAGRSVPGVRITVKKNIPTGGGMGGGSSDAATALHGLNLLWRLGYSKTELAEIGLQLGADVPVFIHGRTSWAEGIGEVLVPIDLPMSWFVVLVPRCSVSTAEIFLHPDLTRDSSAITIARFLQQKVLSDQKVFRNDCEEVSRILYPEIGKALDWLNQWGAARMSGTGSSVFLEITDKTLASDVLARSLKNWQGFITRSVQESSLVGALNQVEKSFRN